MRVDILYNYSLAKLTTIRIGGVASTFVLAKSNEDIFEAIEFAHKRELSISVLGNGSNLLIGNIPENRLVLRYRGCKAEMVDDCLSVEAGALLPSVARFSVSKNFSGLEWGIKIPGTIGGAVVMNAGAHDSETIDSLAGITVIDWSGYEYFLPSHHIQTAHRWSSIGSDKQIVTKAIFKLCVSDSQRIREKIHQNEVYRLKTQPKGLTLGSTFKRVYDFEKGSLISAGYYIDRCGLKGYKKGDAYISPVHANFIINNGKATAQDILSIMAYVRDCVYKEFGIELEPEIKFWIDEQILCGFGFSLSN